MLVPREQQGRGARRGQPRCTRRSPSGRPTEPTHADRPAHQRGASASAASASSRLAEEHGGKVVTGGGRPGRPRARATTSSRPCSTCPTTATRRRRRRSSGRCIGVLGYDDLDDAVRIANDSVYGLSAQVYGARRRRRDGASARRLRAGAVNVNTERVQRLRARRWLQAERPRPRAGRRGHPRVPGGQAHGDRRTEMTGSDTGARNLDWLISVDDHILEPPNLWIDRVRGQGPRPRAAHGGRRRRRGYWVYDGKRVPELRPERRGRQDEGGVQPRARSRTPRCARAATTPSPGSRTWTSAGILASLCFPTITRFCGQLFMEASDREFGLELPEGLQRLDVEEWCGAAPGRYIPLMLIPMWDPQLAVAEMERMRGQGRRRRSPSRRTRHRSACPPSTTRTATGIR